MNDVSVMVIKDGFSWFLDKGSTESKTSADSNLCEFNEHFSVKVTSKWWLSLQL